jgi:hypothetical protein
MGKALPQTRAASQHSGKPTTGAGTPAGAPLSLVVELNRCAVACLFSFFYRWMFPSA